MFSRIKQGVSCLFLKFDKKNLVEIKKILSKDEFNIFNRMSDYDKLHRFNVYLKVKENELLKDDENYLKLALLHDSGKGHITIFRRVKKVLVGDRLLEKHPEIAYEKLKEINLLVAKLCRNHHNVHVDKKMQVFQRIDDQ